MKSKPVEPSEQLTPLPDDVRLSVGLTVQAMQTQRERIKKLFPEAVRGDWIDPEKIVAIMGLEFGIQPSGAWRMSPPEFWNWLDAWEAKKAREKRIPSRQKLKHGKNHGKQNLCPNC